MDDFPADEDEGGVEVIAPSGARFHLLNEGEQNNFNDVAARYLIDNHFTNVSDLQDLDRIIIMEVMSWRWSSWLSLEQDWEGQNVNLEDLKKGILENSREIRLMKKSLGLDKGSRDKDKGESVAGYIEELRRHAREFGVMREEQLTKGITLFQELKALMIFHLNCTPEEREENNCEEADILAWIQDIAIPEFDVIDEHFRQNTQKFWIRSL